MTDIYKWLFGARGRSAVTAPLPLLPDALQPFAGAIGETLRPIIAAGVLDGPPPRIDGSQLGGRPWWPKGRPFPKDKNGAQLYLLSQINFAETPALDPFPRTGLLQVFIGQGDLYGANLEDLLTPDGFQCVYHEDLQVAADTKIAPQALRADGYLPLEQPLTPRALAFHAEQMVVDPSDYRFQRLLPEIANSEELVEAYAEWISSSAAVSAIRLGGYPTFTQEDPRVYIKKGTIGDTSLLTIDTTTGIMWGDSGAAQFLMHEKDLVQRDFSRVAYNWDCC